MSKKIKLFVNGILDAVNVTAGWNLPNEMPFYVGGTLWTLEDCHLPCYIDELKFYQKELTTPEIEAEASGSLGGIEPSFIQLGCVNCLLKEAATVCTDNYHLCSTIELHSHGYQVARAMGWVIFLSILNVLSYIIKFNLILHYRS